MGIMRKFERSNVAISSQVNLHYSVALITSDVGSFDRLYSKSLQEMDCNEFSKLLTYSGLTSGRYAY